MLVNPVRNSKSFDPEVLDGRGIISNGVNITELIELIG